MPMRVPLKLHQVLEACRTAKNWIETNPGRGWFPLFRFYGPTQPYFDKTWQLADIEEVQ